MLSRVKQLFQKEKIPDIEIWNLQYYIAKFTLPRLKILQYANAGSPARLTQEEWEKIMGKIIFAFERIIEDVDGVQFIGREDNDKVQAGCKLFGKWFQDLWC